MLIDISSIVKSVGETLAIDKEIAVDYNKTLDNVVINNPVVCKGNITNFNNMLYLSSEVIFKYKALCDKCGADVEYSMVLKVEEALIHIHDENVQEDDGIDSYRYDDHRLDLGKIVTDYIYLNMPMSHLCGEACNGICKKCGQNLNNGQCVCENEKAIDPRMEKLKGLFEKDN